MHQVILIAALLAAASPNDEIRRLLQDQQQAWNRGDVRAFMTAYADSGATTFVGTSVTRGYQNVLQRYLKTYPTPEQMGKLAFSDLEIQVLGSGHATVLGRWQLERQPAGGGPVGGWFTLLLRKTPQGWRIFHDHTSQSPPASNWPSWRGPTALGMTTDLNLPTHWTRTENVRWRVELPEPGNSTPIVWGDRVFVTQPLKSQNRRTLMCFDRATGKLLWQSGLDWTAPEPTHATNPYGSASPVTDGQIVVAWFGSAGMAAYDFNGKELWRRDLGIQKHTWGYGTSPVLYGDRVFLNFGPGDRAFLIALDKRTGKTLWQVDTPRGEGQKHNNWSPADMYGSWTTPLALGDQLIVSWARQVVAFDQATGKVLWTGEGLGDLVYPSPIHADGVIVAMGGFGGPSVALRAGGEALWRLPKSRQLIGTGVVRNGYLYVVDIGGIAECLELQTGKVVWTQRLRGSGADNGVWSSPVLAGDKIYVMNRSGETFLFKAAPEFELLGSNSLGEASNSSVVVSNGDLFLRTHAALWRIGRD